MTRQRSMAALAALAAVVGIGCAGANRQDQMNGQLYGAAVAGQLDDVRVLLKKGANPNFRGPDSLTTLIAAMQHLQPDVVKALLDAGADPNAPDSTSAGAPPLVWGIELQESLRKQREPSVAMIFCTAYLINHGANVNAKDREGMTALSHAAMHGDLVAVQVLLEHGGDPSSKDNAGKLALNYVGDDGMFGRSREIRAALIAAAAVPRR
ncbi:MAG: ankyrin repeat domain-containing protein [bacterium]